ncbi:NiFe hydrogenase [Shewanella chilikensis]|uniref:NiFe hydrogenase n=1 Tax=Shewanella chilikensis TaxID=558541 RepID=UPI0030076FE3
MKLVRFEFDCASQQPWYGHLCNQYLNYDKLNITIALLPLKSTAKQSTDATLEQNHLAPRILWRYILEAEGNQSELEQLADEIAGDFLLSTSLLDSRILLAEERLGAATPLALTELLPNSTTRPSLAFCQHCQPRLGDNQHPDFANIRLPCPHCHGEEAVLAEPELCALQPSDIRAMAEQLLGGKSLTLTDSGNRRLKLSLKQDDMPQGIPSGQTLICCNPNSLNAHFLLTDAEVLALSSMEKPALRLRPSSQHPRLTQPLYSVAFADSRLLLIICEYLRIKGCDYLFASELSQPSRVELSWIAGHYLPLYTHQARLSKASSGHALPETLHDEARFGKSVATVQSLGNKKEPQIVLRAATENDANIWQVATDHGAECAFNALLAEFCGIKKAALLYFSGSNPSQIRYLDKDGKQECFFELTQLPASGYEIVHALEQSPQRTVVQKFKSQFPECYNRLLDFGSQQPSAFPGLDALWAVIAIISGLGQQGQSATELKDAFIAAAMSYKGANAPRIDYPLAKGEAVRGLNWCKTLGTVMSFRLAGDTDAAKLCFAAQDSLADYLANWVEHLDLSVGIDCVFLAGSAMANPVLSKRIAIRIGKNFPLAASQQLDLDGALLAAGALWLRQRRR